LQSGKARPNDNDVSRAKKACLFPVTGGKGHNGKISVRQNLRNTRQGKT
jgi:hypothetical protein